MRTSSGFEFELDPKRLDDMELIEALADLDKNPTGIPRVLRLILGDDGKDRLYEHCRDESGRVPASRVGAELTEIFRLGQESIKKS